MRGKSFPHSSTLLFSDLYILLLNKQYHILIVDTKHYCACETESHPFTVCHLSVGTIVRSLVGHSSRQVLSNNGINVEAMKSEANPMLYAFCYKMNSLYRVKDMTENKTSVSP